MSNRRAGRTLRGNFLGSASRLGLAKAKIVFLPIVAGAAFAWGIGFDAEPARAAAGVCAPDASGTAAATGPIESCSGDFATGISYPGAVGTAGSFEVDLNSVTNVADGGVIVSSGGAVNLTVTQFATAGNISNLSGNGIDVTNFGANIAITTVGATLRLRESVSMASNCSLQAAATLRSMPRATSGAEWAVRARALSDRSRATPGNVSITTAANTVVIGNGLTALVGSNVAIYASAADGNADGVAGSVTVTLGNFTAVTLTNAANGAGISADTFGDTGNVNVTLGNGATITLNDGTANDASGIYAVAQDTGNLLTGNVAVALNSSVANHTTITVTGDNNSAITARSEGGGNVTVNTGVNNKLVVNGDTSFGVIATGLSTGAVNVTTGIGSDITVNAGDGAGAIYGFSAGIYAFDGGGNIDVTANGAVAVFGFNAGNLTAPTYGIFAQTFGGGNVSVTATGGVTSQWGLGIGAFSVDGNIAVTSVGPITAATYGIVAESSGTGNVTVTNSGNISQPVFGIYADTANGNLYVNNSGNISVTTKGINAFSTANGAVTVFGNMTTTTVGNITSFNNPNILVSAGTK